MYAAQIQKCSVLEKRQKAKKKQTWSTKIRENKYGDVIIVSCCNTKNWSILINPQKVYFHIK